MKTNHSINVNKNILLLLAAAILVISCSKPVSEEPAAATTIVEPFDTLDLSVPDRYDPPITMNSVISVDATVKFLGNDDIYNNVWTRAYSQLLGVNMNYQWVSDVSQPSQNGYFRLSDKFVGDQR